MHPYFVFMPSLYSSFHTIRLYHPHFSVFALRKLCGMVPWTKLGVSTQYTVHTMYKMLCSSHCHALATNLKFQLRTPDAFLISILGRFHCSCICCVTVCVCLSLSHTHTLTPTHIEHEGADGLVWSRLDSPLLPPLPERGLSAGDQDDSLSWKRFPEDTYFITSTVYTVHYVCTYITDNNSIGSHSHRPRTQMNGRSHHTHNYCLPYHMDTLTYHPPSSDTLLRMRLVNVRVFTI